MCFLPGPFLLDYLVKLGKLRVSKTEVILLGSVVWNFGWVAAAYFVAILTSSMGTFYSLSLGVGAAVILLDLYDTARRGTRFRLPSIGFDNALALALIAVLGVLIATEMFAHTIYQEFDAIFYYLPLAKSIVLTGGLHFDPLHATGLTTTMPPALPLMYGSVLSFSGSLSDFGTAARIIPLFYFMLTSLGVYALSSEFFEDSKLALASAVCFLSLPVLMSISLNFTLYLDMASVFVATVSMYLVVVVVRHQGSDSFRWLALGATFGLMLLVKDTAYFIVPSLFILAIIPCLRGLGRSAAALLGALVFTGIFTFFFAINVLFPLGKSELAIVGTQTTTFATLVLAFLILRRMELDKVKAPSGRQILLLILPSALSAVYILRNILDYGVESFSLNMSNAVVHRAVDIVDQASPSSASTAPGFKNLLEILFSYNAGFTFFLPLVIGLASLLIVYKAQPERYGFFFLFWLVLIDLWGWEFNFSYAGSMLRWVYPFAPLIALGAAAGVGFVSRRWKLQDSMVIRLVLFESLALLYLWTGPLKLSAGDIASIAYKFEYITPATLQSLAILSVLFLVAFIPIHFVDSRRLRDTRKVGRIIVVGALLLLLVFPVYSFAAPAIANSQETSAAVPAKAWQNHLPEVLSFVNDDLPDNYTILAFYALPIAYFTNHPVIDLCTYYGVASLLGLVGVNESTAMRALLDDGVHYLLMPLPGNTYYSYYISLTRDFTFLSPSSLVTNPMLLPVSNFTDYQLYQVVA